MESCLCKSPRHGDCEACRAHHSGKKHPVRCERRKRLFSRRKEG